MKNDNIKRMRLVELRKKSRMTQQEVADRAGMTRREVSQLERCEDPAIPTLRKYLKGLGGNLEFFIVFPNEDSEAIKL